MTTQEHFKILFDLSIFMIILYCFYTIFLPCLDNKFVHFIRVKNILFFQFYAFPIFSMILLLFSLTSWLLFIILIFFSFFPYFSFSLIIFYSSSWLTTKSISAWDIRVSIPLSLLLASITISLCFFFLFLVISNTLFIIPVVKENARVKLALFLQELQKHLQKK